MKQLFLRRLPVELNLGYRGFINVSTSQSRHRHLGSVFRGSQFSSIAAVPISWATRGDQMQLQFGISPCLICEMERTSLLAAQARSCGTSTIDLPAFIQRRTFSSIDNGNTKGTNSSSSMTRTSTTTTSNTNSTSTTSTGNNSNFYESRWEENLQKYRIFVEKTLQNSRPPFTGSTDYAYEHERAPVPLPSDKSLRMWLTRQKLEWKRKIRGQDSLITDQRIHLLQSAGFSFTTVRERSWDTVYEQLRQFVEKNNGLFPYDFVDIDTLDAEGVRLFYWCQHQRVNFKYYELNGESRTGTLMSQERFNKLNSINFSWNLRDYYWEEKYRELQVYYEHHKDCLVPAAYASNPSLAKWVERQRSQYWLMKENKPHVMNPERLIMLEKLDFIWDVKEFKWQSKYKELLEYQKHNGYGMFPRSNDHGTASLFRWIKYQHLAYKRLASGQKTSMTPERKTLLDDAGIQWNFNKRQ